MNEPLAPKAPTLTWEFGTAYEFFISLMVLHAPDFYGIRASWAAGIRSRIPLAERTFLEGALPFFGVPLCWIHKLPPPKDAISVLWALRQIPPERRAGEICCLDEWKDAEGEVLRRIADKGGWDDEDLEAVKPILKMAPSGLDEVALKRFLDLWSHQADYGESLLAALQAYYQAFFEEEEKRLAPILMAGLEHAKATAEKLNVIDLVAELSQGVHLDLTDIEELIIAPAYWTTPLIMFEKLDTRRQLFLFGARPTDMSAIPGEMVPDALLRTLKALADSTRLKILYYLSREELTPSELSRRLHLRAPTLTHHLRELRLSGLVNLTVKGQEKFYSSRREALKNACANLDQFLDRV